MFLTLRGVMSFLFICAIRLSTNNPSAPVSRSAWFSAFSRFQQFVKSKSNLSLFSDRTSTVLHMWISFNKVPDTDSGSSIENPIVGAELFGLVLLGSLLRVLLQWSLKGLIRPDQTSLLGRQHPLLLLL